MSIPITSITYRRVKNLGNHETEAVEATVAVEPGDNEGLAFLGVQHFVLQCLGQLPCQADTIKGGDIDVGDGEPPFADEEELPY